ncbi:membrane hypothetical protein [Verrucomicrobia bacterium]|nr:membrane hypothetical protein [Verrucomicrobiota bacterium]
MNDSRVTSVEPNPPAGSSGPPVPARTGHWKPVLTLLLLSPAVGELLSGSSPPLQFFNPLFLLLLVGLYGCGALLIREMAIRHQLNSAGILLLGAAYAIVEEGLTCKSFFNPCWTDTGFLSVYGRTWGVNWVWTFGLTFYHAVVSITVPIFLTEALFPLRSGEPWLRRRGWKLAGASLGLVVVLGFLFFDNRQFHLIEIKDAVGLAQRLNTPAGPIDQFVLRQFTVKNQALVRQAVSTKTDSPDLRHALQDELNRLLPRADLGSADRFATVNLPEKLRGQLAHPPRGDKLVEFNRALLERAYPESLATRQSYPYRPAWWLTLGCVVSIGALLVLALRSRTRPSLWAMTSTLRRPWLTGLAFTAGFVLVGFVLPSLVEHGLKLPAVVACALWCPLSVLLARLLMRTDSASDHVWRRGLWALGIISPWVLFAVILGVSVQMIGAKSFSGMTLVALGFALAILGLAIKWTRRLNPVVASPGL